MVDRDMVQTSEAEHPSQIAASQMVSRVVESAPEAKRLGSSGQWDSKASKHHHSCTLHIKMTGVNMQYRGYHMEDERSGVSDLQ